jgi:hypothetical protein
MVKKWSNLYSSGRIHIQTIKFEFKRTNQELTAHYRPSAPVAGNSASGTAQPGFRAGATPTTHAVLHVTSNRRWRYHLPQR